MDNSIIQSSAYYLVLLRAHLLDISSILFFVIVYIYIYVTVQMFLGSCTYWIYSFPSEFVRICLL